MADIEVSYENQVIKSLSASGQIVCHTAGKFCDDDITIDYTSPGGGGAPEYVYDDTDEYTFAEDASGTPASIYPDFIGSAWGNNPSSNLRMWYCYSKNNGAQTNQFLCANIALGTGTSPVNVVTGRRNSSNNTTFSVGTGSAITVKFTAGSVVKIVKLKNPLIDSFT